MQHFNSSETAVKHIWGILYWINRALFLNLQCSSGYMWPLHCAPFALYNLSNGLLIAFDTLLTTTASLPTYLDRVAYGCLPHHSQLQWLLMALPHRHLIEAGSVMGSWTTPYGAVKWPIAENSFYLGEVVSFCRDGWSRQTYKLRLLSTRERYLVWHETTNKINLI